MKVTPGKLCWKERHPENIYGMKYSESAHPMIPVYMLKPRYWEYSEMCSLLVVNNKKYLSYVVDSY